MFYYLFPSRPGKRKPP